VDARDIAVLILVVGLVAFAIAYFTVGPGRRRGPKPAGDIPLAMRPYHSDEELEGRGMERAMAWGAAFVLFMALFLPAYWLLEPTRIAQKRAEHFELDVTQGRILFADACAQCHGTDAGGGFAAHPDPDIDAPWPAPALDDIVPRLREDPRFADVADFRAEAIRFITETTKQGRPGTPMPPWSVAYGGGMTDFEIDAIVRYILAIQPPEEEEAEALPEPQAWPGADGQEIFAANCARCHGPGAQGGMAAPPLTEVFAKFGAAEEGDPDAEAAVRHIIENGILVPAATPMPAWRNELTGDAIDRVLEYLWTIQEGIS
jgi:mono/diheme cytochrome c family protein